MKIKFTLFILLSCILFGCGVPEEDYNREEKRADSLQILVDNWALRMYEVNNENNLVFLIDNNLAENKFEEAKKNINTLKGKYPRSKHIARYDKFLPAIEAERALNALDEMFISAFSTETGVWKVSNYVNNSGKRTNQSYIYTEVPGRYETLRRDRERIKVRFLIDKENIRIQLFDRLGSPIREFKNIKFGVVSPLIKKYFMSTYNVGTDIYVQKSNLILGDSQKLLLAFVMGGEINFQGESYDVYGRKKGTYSFTIENASYFVNAFDKAGFRN